MVGDKTILKIEDLHKIYEGRIHAVKGVSFTVSRGEIFGLIGPNGAGKTTTLRMISTLLKPTRGRIILDDIDVVEKPLEARKYIGYLPEEADVYSRLTGYEHLRLYAMLYGVEDIDETIRFGAELSGLEKELERRAGEYSKGMKRRLLLALVLMRKPKLAVLDEPTSGLDVYASVRVRKMIKKYVRETGASVVLSSHNMLEVEYLCDRIAFIYNGRIIDLGRVEEIKEKYNALNLEEAFVQAIEEAGKV